MANKKKTKKKHKHHRPHYERNLDEITAIKAPVLFAELNDEQKAEATQLLEELIDGFFLGADYLPDDEDRDNILAELRDGMSDTLNQWEPEPFDPVAEYYDPRFDFGPEVGFDERIARMKEILDAEAEDFDPYAEPEEPEPKPQKELIADAELKAVFDKIVAHFAAAFEVDGVPLPTFIDSLIVAETERLKIRRFYKNDLVPLCSIMSKPEVMYAWEAGFHKHEVRKWLNNQYTRYHKDGYGYFAVILKDTGKLIGQVGLMKLELNGETVVEIGYIFDNRYWGHGYAIEATRACVDLAFGRFGNDKLYATIRPENAASVKLAVKLGMRKVGEVLKTYKDKDMPHDIYVLEKIREWSKMNETNNFDIVAGKSQAEAKELMIQLFSSMTPARFAEHMENMRYMAQESGQQNEREELVCRLLASGMPVEEISVVLCLRTDAVRIIEHNNAATTIPDYAKKLKDRRRRREKQST